MNQEYNRQWMS